MAMRATQWLGGAGNELLNGEAASFFGFQVCGGFTLGVSFSVAEMTRGYHLLYLII